MATRYAPAPPPPGAPAPRAPSSIRNVPVVSHRCTCLKRVKAAVSKAAWWLWPFDHESGVWVACDVGYLCANFGLPRPLCSRLRPMYATERRQTDVRQKHRLMLPPIRGGGIINERIQLSALLTTFKTRPIDNLQINNLLSCMELTLLIQGIVHAQVCLSLCVSGHWRVLEYSLSYSSSTRVTNYSVSAAVLQNGIRA